MRKTQVSLIFVSLFFIALLLPLSSAITVKSSDIDQFSPGSTGRIRITLENNLGDDATDVSLSLNLAQKPFISVGSSEESTDEIRDNKEEDFVFSLTASNDAKPGNYEIPYTISYTLNSVQKTKQGTLGVRIKANPDLVFSLTAENPIISQKGKISLKIVNRGFYDARFLTVKAIPGDFNFFSNKEVYIGSVDSDDFETASFDVIFTKSNPVFIATIDYIDFDNSKITKTISLPVDVYTKEKAIEIGLIKKNYIPVYIGIVIALILLWLLWRMIKKRSRLKRSMENSRR